MGNAWISIWPLVNGYVINLVTSSQTMKLIEDLLGVCVFLVAVLEFLSKNLTYPRWHTHPYTPQEMRVSAEEEVVVAGQITVFPWASFCSPMVPGGPLPARCLPGCPLTRAVSTRRARA